MIKTIRKLTCEEFLAAKHARGIAQKHSKGFICVFVLILSQQNQLNKKNLHIPFFYCTFAAGNEKRYMCKIENIYSTIDKYGFAPQTLNILTNYSKGIQDGTITFDRFNLSEHEGLRAGGDVLIEASIIADYARTSFGASPVPATGSTGTANWEIDARQEQILEQYAKAKDIWFEDSETQLIRDFGPKIAQGAESKVYYKVGDYSVIKERTSIYSTLQKALDAIVLHNMLFRETQMFVIGFTRDSDSLFRIILTQPYIECARLATKQEIDELVFAKGFRDNWAGEGVNYISDRLKLEDMHPANVFVRPGDLKPICIDCIVKFI